MAKALIVNMLGRFRVETDIFTQDDAKKHRRDLNLPTLKI